MKSCENCIGLWILDYQEYPLPPQKWKLVKIVQDFGLEVTKNNPPPRKKPCENSWGLVCGESLYPPRIPSSYIISFGLCSSQLFINGQFIILFPM